MDTSLNRDSGSLNRGYLSGQGRGMNSLLNRFDPRGPSTNGLLPRRNRNELPSNLLQDPRSRLVSDLRSRRQDILLLNSIPNSRMILGSGPLNRFENRLPSLLDQVPQTPARHPTAQNPASSLSRRQEPPSLNNFPNDPRRRENNNTASMFTSERDHEMASRQTRIESLPPDQRREQESWAQDQLKGYKGVCAFGFKWKRVQGGYRCGANVCFVTDELLAEGKGGYYEVCSHGRLSKNPPKTHGPFYPGDEHGPNSGESRARLGR